MAMGISIVGFAEAATADVWRPFMFLFSGNMGTDPILFAVRP
jgi:hypothetical protein